MSSRPKLRPRPGRDAAGNATAASTGPRPGSFDLGDVLAAAGVAVGAPPHAARLCRELVLAATADDDGQRLGVLAGTASLDPRLAGNVIGVLAATAAALAGLE